VTEPGCALVTGGSRGIGAACAIRLAQAGWPIAVNYRSSGKVANEVVRTIESAGGRALAVGADVSDRDEVDRMFSRLEDDLGTIRILVNNAGIRADSLTVRMTEEDWFSVLQTNLFAAYLTCRRALMPMVRSRFGRIVNIASVVGPNIGNPGQVNYGAAKAGLVGLTRCMAREVARKGVTVNAVAPGFVQTDMTSDVDLDFIRGVPAKRAGTPEDVAACVGFLASEDAGYVTGTTLTVDGGLTA
jgi:3-oxoacyl-[acyl-carrier protein] reductase